MSPVEPLHDIKGHLSNLIDELRISLNGEVKEKVEAICSTVLGKETLRGCDYRKGSILILHTLQELQPSSPVTALFETAVEITEILYSDPSKRCSQSVLRLHNLAFVHATLCRDQFNNPKTMSSRKMFGRYFHAFDMPCPTTLPNHLPSFAKHRIGRKDVWSVQVHNKDYIQSPRKPRDRKHLSTNI